MNQMQRKYFVKKLDVLYILISEQAKADEESAREAIIAKYEVKIADVFGSWARQQSAKIYRYLMKEFSRVKTGGGGYWDQLRSKHFGIKINDYSMESDSMKNGLGATGKKMDKEFEKLVGKIQKAKEKQCNLIEAKKDAIMLGEEESLDFVNFAKEMTDGYNKLK